MGKEQQIEEITKIIGDEYDSAEMTGSELHCYEVAELIYEAGHHKQEWISVEESFPEEGSASVVAVIYRDNPTQDWERVVTAAYLVPINGEIDGVWVLLDEKMIESKEIHITHWMPLPELPKMKGESNEQRAD